jgi:hypothetical protein
MKEIKSVRVRRTNVKSGTLDIKVTLYEDKRTFGADDRVLVGFNNDRPVWIETTYRLKGIFKDFTDDQFITDFIDMNARSEGGGSEYEIIQDPWESKVPIWRKYGFDPYYLNNGAEIYINWTDENNMVVGGLTYSDNNGNEIDGQGVVGEGTVPSSFTKSHWIVGVDDPSKDQNFLLHLTKNNEIDYRKLADVKEYGGLVKDIYIIEDIISAWKRKVPNYNELALCSPNNESCSIIPYKSPMKPIEPEPVPADVVPANEIPKEPIIVVLPESIKVKIDTTFKIFIGKNKELIETQTVLQDDELTDLSDEYSEEPFAGVEEEELKLQEQISSGQEDSDSQLVEPGTPANIRPFNNLDSLLRLAGDCARELGKNPRVNYGNLRSGYIKGVHGLCPQGTLSVLYALTGIKKVGTIRGNANTFAMNGSNSFTGTGYFNNKLKISKDYFNSPDKWQIGDVVANDYTGGKPYGHIQVWTGFKWVSDFTQNKLQISNVDWNSVALHRLNDKGLDLVKKQSQSIV